MRFFGFFMGEAIYTYFNFKEITTLKRLTSIDLYGLELFNLIFKEEFLVTIAASINAFLPMSQIIVLRWLSVLTNVSEEFREK